MIGKRKDAASKPSKDSASSRKEKKELMRDDIARVAFELFMEQSYEKTTMRQIAYRAKILNGSLYNIYPSKDDIFDYIFMKTVDTRNNKCIEIVTDEKDYLFALALPFALELYIGKENTKLAELIHEAYSNWNTFNKIVDLDIGWIASVSEKFGIPLEQDRLKPMIIAIDGGFSKIIDRYIFEHEGDFQEDLRTLMILLFTLLNLPLHSIDHLTQRFVEMFSSAETWSNMELWRKE